MADPEIANWFGDLVSHPKVVVDANSVEDIVAVMKDAAKYPAPVRAVGSNHSTSPCGVAEGGTLIRMKMNRILDIGRDTLTVEAGARHIDMARELGFTVAANRDDASLMTARLTLHDHAAACKAPA